MSVRLIIMTTCENAHFLFILLERAVISKFAINTHQVCICIIGVR